MQSARPPRLSAGRPRVRAEVVGTLGLVVFVTVVCLFTSRARIMETSPHSRGDVPSAAWRNQADSGSGLEPADTSLAVANPDDKPATRAGTGTRTRGGSAPVTVAHTLVASLSSAQGASNFARWEKSLFVSDSPRKVFEQAMYAVPKMAEKELDVEKVLQIVQHAQAARQSVLNQFQRRPARDCAVVGNSGQMLGSSLGASIDSKELVFRMNDGRTRKFEEDVGRRTTFRLAYPEVHYTEPGRDTMQVFPLFRPNDIEWLLHRMDGRAIPSNIRDSMFRNDLDESPVANVTILGSAVPRLAAALYDSHADLLQRDRRKPTLQKAYASSGCMTVLLATFLCQHVTLYGFGAFNNMASKLGIPYHYYPTDRHPYMDKNPDRDQPAHAYDVERRIYATLEAKGRLEYGDKEIVEKMKKGIDEGKAWEKSQTIRAYRDFGDVTNPNTAFDHARNAKKIKATSGRTVCAQGQPCKIG